MADGKKGLQFERTFVILSGMAETDTKTLILDTAEELFSNEGYHGVSVRAITKKAGVHLASVNYHFGSKEELYEEVFRRRAVPINDERCKRLGAILSRAESAGENPGLKDIVRAFIEPTIRGAAAIKNIPVMMSILHRPLSREGEIARNAFMKAIGPSIALYFEALTKAMPGADPGEIKWKMMFSIGTFIPTIHIQGGTFKQMPLIPKADAIDKVVDRIVAFVTAGMKAG